MRGLFSRHLPGEDRSPGRGGRHRDHRLHVPAQDVHRPHPQLLGQGGEPLEVGEDDGQLPLLPLERRLVRPDGKFAYVLNELDSTITAFAYDAKAGALKELRTVTTLPGWLQAICGLPLCAG